MSLDPLFRWVIRWIASESVVGTHMSISIKALINADMINVHCCVS